MEHFELTHETTYDQYVCALHSKKVPYQNLITNTYPKLICKFTAERNRCDRLHLDCIRETYPVVLSTFRSEYCYSKLNVYYKREKKNGCVVIAIEDCLFIHHVSVSIGKMIKSYFWH